MLLALWLGTSQADGGLDLICGPNKTKDRLSAHHSNPAFVLSDSGGLTIEENGETPTFQINSQHLTEKPEIVVRVERIAARGRGVIACESVTVPQKAQKAQRLTLALAGKLVRKFDEFDKKADAEQLVQEGDILDISVWGIPSTDQRFSAFNERLKKRKAAIAQRSTDSDCNNRSTTRWLNEGYKVLVRAQVPYVRISSLVEVYYDSGRMEQRLASEARAAVVVHNVPDEARLAFMSKRKNLASSNSLSSFLKAIVLLGESMRRKKVADACPDYTIDESLPSVAGMGPRAYVTRAELGDSSATINVCAGDKCILEGGKKNVTDEVSISPMDSTGFHILLGLSGYGILNSTRLVGVGSTTGPDQLFELTEDGLAFDWSLDLMAGLRFCDDWFAGLGTTIVADEVNPIEQWRVGIGGRFVDFSDYVYVMGTVGFLMQDEPRELDVGDRLAVEGAGLDQVSPPSLATDAEVRFVIGITVGVDFAVLGETGDQIVSAFRGESK